MSNNNNSTLHPQVVIHESLARNLASRERNKVAFPAYHEHAHSDVPQLPSNSQSSSGAHSGLSHHQQQRSHQPGPHQPSAAMRDRARSGGQTPRDMVWVDSKERLSEMASDIRGISSALSNVALAVPVSRIMIMSKLADDEIEDKVRDVTRWLLNWSCDGAHSSEYAEPMYMDAKPRTPKKNKNKQGHQHHPHQYRNKPHTNLHKSVHQNLHPSMHQHIHHNHPQNPNEGKWYTGSDSDEKSASGAPDIFSSSPPQSTLTSQNSSANSSYLCLDASRDGSHVPQNPVYNSDIPRPEPPVDTPIETCTAGNLVVYVQDILYERGVMKGEEFALAEQEGRLKKWNNETVAEKAENIDLIVTLGGDGTVLYTSWLFQKMVPPVLSFALGSLGFMTENEFDDYQNLLDHSLTHGICCTLRMRFECVVMRTKNPEKIGTYDLQDEIYHGGQSSRFTTHTTDGKYSVLNEVVLDRGPNPFVTMTELYGDYELLTSIRADGVVISTPTGSTAYSMSAGGSLVHPDIPARLISPICPHTLSFRPLVLPDSMALHIGVPYDARSSAFVSFDGKARVELRRGDFLAINVSKYPFPKVLPPNSTSVSWVQQLSRTLHWNEQKRPKRYTDGGSDNWNDNANKK